MKTCLLFFLLFPAIICWAGNPETSERLPVVSGYVRDAQSGELLIGATVYNYEKKDGTISNFYGFYSLSMEQGEHTLVFAFLGYKTMEMKVKVTADLALNVELESASTNLKEVKIVANQSHTKIDDPLMGVQRIQASAVKDVPVLMGEVDAIKVIQLMPGVQAASEGSSGFSVRGGNPDQNLVLLDEATVYNSGHLLGFFSVFNNDVIKDVSLYKGDIPARSGGRLSSLLDIRMKDGNNKNLSATGGIGSISSRLALEGPLFSDKTTFVVAGRRTYADLFLKLSSDEAVRDNILYFYDFNAKVNHTFSDRDRIYLSGYFGRDVFKNNYAGIDFGNQTLTFRWNHVFSPRLFSNVTLINSNYDYGMKHSEDNSQGFVWTSNMKDYSMKIDFNYYPNTNNSISFGAQTIVHNIMPGWVKGKGDNTLYNDIKMDRNYSLEHAIYAENTQKISPSFNVRYGMRVSAFQNIGKGVLHEYDENYKVVNTNHFKKGEVYHTYWGFEPRAGVTYLINDVSSIKGGYSRTYQYLHLASNSAATTPLDVWFASSPNVKPQVSDQVSLGVFRQFRGNAFDVGVEAFYKNMDNAIDFRDYAELILNEYLDGELRFGKAYAYGVEFLNRFNYGRWSGWVGYTWSRSKRKINGINNNEWYLSPYDHTHDCSLVVTHKTSNRVTLSGNWVYSTGAPVTFPVGRYESGNDIIPIYSKRNAERMPSYHRLDLSCTLRNKEKPGRKWQSEWVFSAYNAYGRKNAWSIYFEQDEKDAYRTKAMKTYLFSVVPSITYNFKF